MTIACLTFYCSLSCQIVRLRKDVEATKIYSIALRKGGTLKFPCVRIGILSLKLSNHKKPVFSVAVQFFWTPRILFVRRSSDMYASAAPAAEKKWLPKKIARSADIEGLRLAASLNASL